MALSTEDKKWIKEYQKIADLIYSAAFDLREAVEMGYPEEAMKQSSMALGLILALRMALKERDER